MNDSTAVDSVATTINDCGTAAETARIAASLKHQADYLASCSAPPSAVQQMFEAYYLLRNAVAQQASLRIDDNQYLDAAIMEFFELPD